MKHLSIYLLPVIFCCISFPGSKRAGSHTHAIIPDRSWHHPFKDPITLQQAEEILGEPARLTDKKVATVNGITTYSYAFKAISGETSPGKGHALYFALERYPDADRSARDFAVIKTSNQTHPGFNVLSDVGDEGFVQTDRKNFYFMMVRRNASIMKLKLSKISDKTSFEVFQNTGKKISQRI